jgi:signal peptidase II
MARVKHGCLLKASNMARNKNIFKSGSGGWLWLGIALIILLLDQLTKIAVVGAFQLGETLPMTSFFNLVRWFFTGLGAVAALVMLYLMRMHAGQTLFCLALSLLLGGAVGNVIDRVLYGHVIDFLDFYYGTWHFPAFNVADSAISMGACLLILDELLRVRRGR